MYVFSYFPLGFEGMIWDLIVSIPDLCLTFYFKKAHILTGIMAGIISFMIITYLFTIIIYLLF